MLSLKVLKCQKGRCCDLEVYLVALQAVGSAYSAFVTAVQSNHVAALQVSANWILQQDSNRRVVIGTIR